MRASTLQNTNLLAVNREIGSKYDVIKAVREKLVEIELVAGMDLDALITELENAQDFTGITVVSGTEVAWDAVNKVLTVPRGEQGVKGDNGDKGDIGPQGPQGPRGAQGPQGLKGDIGPDGPRGLNGPKGDSGKDGKDGKDLTVTQIVYNSDGTFTWLFSDGTNYTTPNLKGPKGDEGEQGPRGKQGTGVHHLKPTSTTDSEGDFGTFGELDTYTFYADPHEKLPLGHFIVRQGITPEMTEGLGLMKQSLYDINRNGIVDNSEALSGKTLEEIEEERDLLLDTKYDKTGGMIDGSVTISGDLIVSGSTVTVDSETLLVKDNTLVLNNGEVGAGVTKGEAGIEVDRGSLANYKFVFSESDESFKIGEDGSLQKVATREDTPLDTGVAVWSSVDNTFTTTRDISIDTITTSGLVNGRDVGVDGTKLDTIEENAKDDQTGAEIKALYEAELDTNAYTDSEKSKLDGIEDGATADQTAEEIEALYEINPNTNKYTDDEKSRVAVSVLLQTKAQTLPDAINEIDSRLDDLNLSRADKVLASKDVANLIYDAGNLVKIRYTTDDDVDYEVLTYVGEDLTNVAHYINGVLQGNTVLMYSDGDLVSSIFVGV